MNHRTPLCPLSGASGGRATKKVVNDFVVEVKGRHIKLTGKGIQRLAQQVDEGIQRYGSQ